LALVVFFMLIYYRGSGINAIIALMLNMILMLAGLIVFGATLTLPGIAGIILTIGMAVDSNVLIFERICAEMRSGKTIPSAILLMLAGMGTALYRHKFHPNGTDAFNLGVDFKGGTVATVRFKNAPSVDQLRAAVDAARMRDAIIQPVLDKKGMFLIKLAHQGFETGVTENQAGVDAARANLRKALNTFGPE